ncbi:MAG: ComEC/Rec2 family competence protein, partial [Pirellulaceae bacterium]|nr:ComEC/Rec2 family competence protein [Pirellulaceae bacterium]
PRELPPSAESWSTLRGSRLLVELVAIRDRTQWRPASGRATLLLHDDDPRIEAGDRLRCFARLSSPPTAYNPGSFDRAAWNRADGILSNLRADAPECVSVIASGGWWNIKRLLDRVRSRGNRQLKIYLDPRQSELAAAVLLGLREELDYERSEAFLTTGTIHLLAISGLHLGILAFVLFSIVKYLPVPRGWALAAIALLTVLYAVMVDARPSVVRATILVLIACLAMYLRRPKLSMNSLAAAALFVLVLNPNQLFQAGPQLSFLCVAGLIWIAPRRPHWNDEEKASQTLKRLEMENLGWFPWLMRKGMHSVRGLCIAGVVLWFLTLPLVIARFHIFSPVALVLNVLLWPLMCASMICGFSSLVLGALFQPLGFLCGQLCNLFFGWLESLIHLAQRVPYRWFPGPDDWWLWGFYGGLGAIMAFPRLRPPMRWCVGLLAVWIAVGFASAGNHKPPDRLDCTFLSVGHGCAALLELPSDRTILYDAGQLGSPHGCSRTIAEFLWHKGLTHIDAVVISHPDADHFNALPGLLEKISVGAVYVSPIMFDESDALLTELRAALDRHGVPVREIHAGDRLHGGDGCTIEVLHPLRGGILGSDNANSVVLAVEAFGRRIILPGDLEEQGLRCLLAEEPTPCDVLLAPHHGSRKSNSPELAQWCRPRWVVLSGDGKWNASDIEATYRTFGGRVVQTSRRGAIRASITAEGVQLYGFVEPEASEPSQRNTTISPGERNRGWRKITCNRPPNASMISPSCRSVAMMYTGPGWSRNSPNVANAVCRSPSHRVTGWPA